MAVNDDNDDTIGKFYGSGLYCTKLKSHRLVGLDQLVMFCK